MVPEGKEDASEAHETKFPCGMSLQIVLNLQTQIEQEFPLLSKVAVQ